MEYIFIFALGWFVGHTVLLWRFKQQIKKIAQSLGLSVENSNSNDEDETDIPPLCVVERHGEELYLFDKRTNVFYCQASTLEELAESLCKNRKIDLACVVDDQKKFWFVKGKIETQVANES